MNFAKESLPAHRLVGDNTQQGRFFDGASSRAKHQRGHNDVYNYVTNEGVKSGDFAEITDLNKTWSDHANKGQFVLILYYNADGGSGHIATAVPTINGDRKTGLLIQAGGKSVMEGTKTINESFGKTKRTQIKAYYYTRKTIN